ncbi:MAG TPA: FHA domain-containing protein [Polyangia bacterium]|jgi:pSer/pThr/pTyr-binding forkhead associated (FHA) protein|nr:FHA domain-containing protein [Polyangia bacterium]
MAGKICPHCGTEVPPDNRFCGKCGGKVDGAPAPGGANVAKTMFFGANQVAGRAKLIVIKGEGVDGVTYQLNGTEHVAGRTEGAILFPDDPLLSPRHANFVYREGKLSVLDEASVNGVFVRIKAPIALPSGGVFLIGEQLLQVEPSPPDLGPQPDAEGTYFYASPKRPSKMKLIQRLRGGEIGMIYRSRGETITIGREGNDVNFLDDPFISGKHAQVNISNDGQITLTDLGSKNGTFVRINDEAPLGHGDYVFLGQQLLRVEMV